jgi:hypothetical protein
MWRPSYTFHQLHGKFNVANFTYKGKKAGTTFETRPTICTSLVNEGKTQVGRVVAVECKYVLKQTMFHSKGPPIIN